jgi:hypothetical protein
MKIEKKGAGDSLRIALWLGLLEVDLLSVDARRV